MNLQANDIQINDGYIHTSYGDIYYKKFYTNENKDNTPLLVLHGGSGMTHDSVDTISELASEFPVIFYDQTGAGKSNNYDKGLVSWDVNFFLEDLENVVEYFKLDNIYLLGYSWGGTLALEYALKHKDVIKKLILASPFLSDKHWTSDQLALLDQLEPDIKKTILKHIEQKTTNSQEYHEAMKCFNKRFLYRLPQLTESIKRSIESMNLEVYETMFGTNEFAITGNIKNYDRFKEVQTLKMPLLLRRSQ